MRRLLTQFLQLESASAIVLFLMALLAVVWVNSPFAAAYDRLVEMSSFAINDGLMAIFFLAVGLELKSGYQEGELTGTQLLLPAFAALGGIIVPALIYCGVNYPDPMRLTGWAIPMATDIAFALGVLSLFGQRVPIGLKLFLLALAIFDDLAAIIVIAVFYAHDLSWLPLIAAGAAVIVLYVLNRASVQALWAYFSMGAILWAALLYSGVHPTLAGVLLALFVPGQGEKPLVPVVLAKLHPWVAFFIMPLFALANAGISLKGFSWQIIAEPIVLGIIAGLFLGKQLGIFGFSWVLIKLRIASLPDNVSWIMLYGLALICGIGFTMSLFLGTLSFQFESTYLAEVRLGVIIGSILSGLTGALVLVITFARDVTNDRSSTFG